MLDVQLFTITEYMQNGSLADVLHKPNSRSGSYGWYQNGKYVALGVARGLAYLHSQSVSNLSEQYLSILPERLSGSPVLRIYQDNST